MRARIAFTRLLLHTLRVGVAVVPTGLVIFFSTLYLFRCANALSAPGVPLKVIYQGAEGQVTARVTSYSVDISRMAAHVTGLDVRSAAGAQIYAADAMVRLDKGVNVVNIYGLKGRIVRRKDGTIDVSSLGLKPSGQPDNSATTAKIEKADIEYVDETIPGLRPVSIHLDNTVAEGARGAWTVTSNITSLGVKSLPVVIDVSKDNVSRIEARFNHQDMAPIWEELLSTRLLSPSAREWSVNHLLADGTMWLDISQRGYNYNGKLKLAFDGLSHPKWINRSSGNFDLVGNSDEVGLDGFLNSGTTAVKVVGALGLAQPLTANLSIDSSNLNLLDLGPEIRRQVPKDVIASGVKLAGRLLLKDAKVTTSGTVYATRLGWQKTVAEGVQGRFAIQQNQLAIDVSKASINKVSLTGALTADLTKGSIKGWVMPAGDIGPALSAYLPKELRLHGKASAIIGGTFSKPQVRVTATGAGTYDVDDKHRVVIDSFVGDGAMDGDLIDLNAKATGPIGTLASQGRLSIDSSKPLSLNLALTGGDLSKWDSQFKGKAEGSASLTGSLKNPQLNGTLTGTDFVYQDQTIPLAQAKINYSNRVIKLDEVESLFAGGTIKGAASLDLDSKAIGGDLVAHSLELNSFKVANTRGAFDSKIKLGGTIESPAASGTLGTGSALLSGYQIDKSSANFSFQKGVLAIDKGVVESGKGIASGDGQFNTADNAWSASVKLNQVRLDRYRAPSTDVAISGLVDGTLNLSGKDAHILSGGSKLQLDELFALNHQVGSGNLSATIKDDVISFDGVIGNDQRFIAFSPSIYSLAKNDATIKADITGVPISEVVAVAEAQTKDPDEKTFSSLKKVGGEISLSLEADYDGKELGLLIPSLTADNLSYDNHPFGSLKGKGSKVGETYKIDQLYWKYHESVANAKAIWQNKGVASGELSASNIDASLLTQIFPSLPLTSGNLTDATLVLDGTADSPHVAGSISVSKVLVRDETGKPLSAPIDASLYKLDYLDRVVTAKGDFAVSSKSDLVATGSLDALVRGLTGTLDGVFPFDAFGDKPTKDFSAKVALGAPRPISTFASFIPAMDDKTSKGFLDGAVTVHGTANNPHVDGHLEIRGESAAKGGTIGFKGSNFSLQNLVAQLDASESGLSAHATFLGSTGGEGSISLKGSWENALKEGFSLDALKTKGQVEGSLKLSNFVAKTTLPQASGPSNAKVTADVQIAGSVGEPRISGNLDIQSLSAVLPVFFQPPEGGAAPAIDPVFSHLAINLAAGSRVDTLAGRFTLGGGGEINGRLSDPRTRMTFDLESGSIRLLTHRVRVEDGSTIAFALEGGGSQPRVDLNLKGRSTITTRSAAGDYQTYLIDMRVSGNLTGTEPLGVTGTSDPPGLSNDQIAAILGEKSFFETLAGTATGQTSSDTLRSSLYSVALPSITDFLTSPIAETLGLDYLNIDYDPFDQALVNTGKRLTRDLSIQWTHQIQQPLYGLRRDDLTLYYRLPSSNKLLSQTRLSIGRTELVPWRFGISFSERF